DNSSSLLKTPSTAGMAQTQTDLKPLKIIISITSNLKTSREIGLKKQARFYFYKVPINNCFEIFKFYKYLVKPEVN
ncbi:MAG: hypothetical protein RIR05_971, partial [Bacteroidota bacterium]